MKVSDLKGGEKFFRLTFIKPTKHSVTPKGVKLARGLFSCSCGNKKDIVIKSVLKGNTKSCGCYNSDSHKDTFKTHGESYTKLYANWQYMLGRVNSKSPKTIENYSGKGITVCEKWLEYTGFKEDMGDSYFDGASLDRIDNDLGYFKENCRWTDISTQNFNRSQPSQPSNTGKTGVRYREDRGYFVASVTKNRAVKSKSFKYMIDAIFQRMLWEQELYGFCKP